MKERGGREGVEDNIFFEKFEISENEFI